MFSNLLVYGVPPGLVLPPLLLVVKVNQVNHFAHDTNLLYFNELIAKNLSILILKTERNG